MIHSFSYLALSFMFFTNGAELASWNQWRGPDRTGIIAENSFPASINENHLKLSWKTPLDPSYSGPVVSNELVFTTETLKKEEEVVHAFSRKDGTKVWSTKWKGSMTVPFFAASNGSWIRATPAFDGEFLYVAGMRDVLVCINAKNGEIKWKLDFVEKLKTPLPAFGFVSSPLLDDSFVYVQAGASACKIDKKTGEILWRSMTDGGGMWGSAFSSPFMANLHGKKLLLVQSREKLAAIIPENGEVLWSKTVPSFRGMNILTPTVINNSIFTSTYQNKSWLFQINKSDSGFEVQESWSNKLPGYMSSPVIIGGHAYLHLQNQRFACIDLANGETKWTSQKSFGKYWSMIASGTRILALDQNGTLHLIDANPKELKILESRKITENESWAHIAFDKNQIIIRDLKSLMVFDWKMNP